MLAIDVMAAALDSLDIPGRKRVMNNVWVRFVVEPELATAPKGKRKAVRGEVAA